MLPAKRDTLDGMETPADTQEGLKKASEVWRFLIEPRWIAWHLLVVVAFWGMLWLGDWQFHRALGGNGLSWAYTFEWPLFSGFSVVFWARTVRDEFRIRRGIVVDEMANFTADDVLPAGLGMPRWPLPEGPLALTAGTPESHEVFAEVYDEQDAEIDSYNDYLAKLHKNIKQTHGRWHGF
jgi:hypothetical protein